MLAIGGAVGLALLLIISGIVYDRLIQPTRTLKQVNNEALTRGEYEQFVRANTIQQIIQGLQFNKLLGSGGNAGQTGRFDEQVVQANVRLTEIGTSRDRQQPLDDATVNQWVDRQILVQGAKQQFNVEPQQGEIDQMLVAQYGALLDTASPITSTETTTATETAATTAATSAAATSAASSPTATALPTATPQPAEATEKANQIVDVLYTEYTNILEALPEGAIERQRQAHTTKEEMLNVMRENLREQVIRERVGEALVKEVPANDTAEPTSINTRHILLQVPKPTPSPSPSPEELEQLFAQRKTEADALYRQLTANPESFPELARENSDDPGSATNGGTLDPFDREGNVVGQQGQTLVKPFVDAAWQLKEGEISQPVRTDFGWHIIQRVPEDPKSKLDRLRTEALDKWLEDQRKQATIVPPPTATPTVEPTQPAETTQPAEGTAQPAEETAQPATTATP
jgi:parvulin-like peptidyl-prolyl isomerase